MRLIDLSLTISEKMPGVTIHPAKSVDKDGWNATTLQLYSHCGTHVDAPIHFGVSNTTIEKMPLSSFSAESWIIDCTNISAKELLTLNHVASIADNIKPGDGLIFKTLWSHKIGTPSYRNELPRISEDLAHWIVAKKIALVGVEAPSVADVNNLDEVTLIHKILLGGGVVIVEGLTNLEEIKSHKIWILALPLKIENGDGCPTRAIAIEI